MSYFPIGNNNEKLIKKGTDNISMNGTQKKNINYARHVTPHSEETKKLISRKQQDRYSLMRELIRKGQANSMTEERVKEIVAETIKKYLKIKHKERQQA